MYYCKFCQLEIQSYFSHAYKNATHIENLRKNYDLIIKNQYIKIIK